MKKFNIDTKTKVISYLLLIFHLSQINSFTLAKIQSDKKRSIMRNFSLKIKDSYIGENKVDNRVFCYRYPIRTKKINYGKCRKYKRFNFCNNKKDFEGGESEKGLYTKYLKRSEREEYKLLIKMNKQKQSLFYNSKGQIADQKGSTLLILDRDFSIYSGLKKRQAFHRNSKGHCIKSDDKKYRIHHSSYNGGRPVFFAGNAIIKSGKIVALDFLSGHYKPTKYHLCNFLTFLKLEGIDINSIKVFYDVESKELMKHQEFCSQSKDFSIFLDPN